MGGDFQDALLKIVIESIPCIFLVQSAIGLKVFSHSFNSVSWFLSTLFCIYILSPIIMLILTRKPCSKKKLIKKMIFVLITYVIVTVMFIKIDNNTFFDDLCYGSPYRRIFYVVFGMLIAMYTNLENNTKIKNKFVPYWTDFFVNILIVALIGYVFEFLLIFDKNEMRELSQILKTKVAFKNK